MERDSQTVAIGGLQSDVEIFCTNLERSRRFYCDVLGLTVVHSMPDALRLDGGDGRWLTLWRVNPLDETGMNEVGRHTGATFALAALGDQGWLAHVRQQVAQGRATIGQIAKENGLSTLPSATNFVAIDCGRDGHFAKAVLDELVANGLFVRMPFVAPQNRCIRVSAGRPEDLELLRDLLPKALSAALAR